MNPKKWTKRFEIAYRTLLIKSLYGSISREELILLNQLDAARSKLNIISAFNKEQIALIRQRANLLVNEIDTLAKKLKDYL